MENKQCLHTTLQLSLTMYLPYYATKINNSIARTQQLLSDRPK